MKILWSGDGCGLMRVAAMVSLEVRSKFEAEMWVEG
jgi:hypothetical protein